MNRRQLLGAAGILAAGAPGWSVAGGLQQANLPALRVYNVSQFGAKGDGESLDTGAINQAIDQCHATGGGTVYLPPGRFLSGTVVLRSNVCLYLEAGATLLGSTKLSDYSPQPGPSLKGDANQKHLVFARDAQNVGLAGPGKIDGQGRAFWVSSGRKVPPAQDHWRDVATYDWKPLDRPSPLIEFYNCSRVRLEHIIIENAAGWTLRPVQCESVFVHGLTIRNPVIGPNTDGIDLTCSRNVFISDCLIDTGDDAICLKSEGPYGDEPRVSKNITITNCVLTCCCNGLKFGTATRGGFENIAFSNSVIFNEAVDVNARVIAGIALEMVDGGWVDGVVISNIQMQRVRTPIFLRRGNRHPRPDGAPGSLRGIRIENLQASGSILTSSITGLPGFHVEDVTLDDIRIDTEEAGPAAWTQRNVPEAEKAYPEARMFGRLPAYGLFCRHVTGLRLRHLEFKPAPKEARPALHCEDVNDLEVSGLHASVPTGNEPVVRFEQTRSAFVHGCSVPSSTATFLEVRGNQTDNIVLQSNNLATATPAKVSDEVPPGAVRT